MDLKTLIEACKKNKREAQSKLYDLYYVRLFSICLRYARNREEAKDLLQESFIKIFQHIHAFSGEGSFEGWCRRITTNTALSYVRSRFFLNAMYTEDVVNQESVQETNYSNNLELNELLNMINKLPMQKKIIFNLYEIEGYNHSEIAEMLHITEGASRGQLAKAKEILRQIHQETNNKTVRL